MNRRTVILLAAVYVLLAACALESYSYMSDQRQESLDAQAGAAVCREVAGKIRQLGRQPALAAAQEQGQSQIDSLIEKAADAAGVNASECVASIKPQEPRRVGDSAYKEKPTQLLLRKVTMEQLVRMSCALLSSSSQLHIKSMSLSAPRDDAGGKTWAAELILTYLIYDPMEARK